MGDWISVKERLPEDMRDCIVWGETAVWMVGHYLVNGESVFKDYDGFAMNGVTHWMPLPEPPEERE